MTEAITVDAGTRWDALDLLDELRGLRTFAVQDRAGRWQVCVASEGPDQGLLDHVTAAVARWLEDRGLDVATVLADGRTHSIAAGGSAGFPATMH